MNARRQLHVGGKIRVDGWEVLNAVPAPEVDHCGDARDLSRFADATFATIYASHVLEHLDYKDELAQTLREWLRVLVPGGRILISVPDIGILGRLVADRAAHEIEERFLLMRMIFGGHFDEFDYHKVGFSEDFLVWFLGATGFTNIRRVDTLGVFDDTSETRFKGVPISLNMIAERPQQSWSGFGWTMQPRPEDIYCICGSTLGFLECHGHLRSSHSS